MSNRTDANAIRVRGTDPQALVPHILRDKIYSCRYWKENCFALNAESIVESAKNLQFAGFAFGGFNRPAPFLCLLTKLLQISPDIDIIRAYIEYSGGDPTEDPEERVHDLRYLRVLAVSYLRLVGRPDIVYSELENLFQDYRKIAVLAPTGAFEVISIDEWVAKLLDHTNQPLFGFVFPTLPRRSVLEARGDIKKYHSTVEDEVC